MRPRIGTSGSGGRSVSAASGRWPRGHFPSQVLGHSWGPPRIGFTVRLLVSGWRWGRVVSHAGAWAPPRAQVAGPQGVNALFWSVSHGAVRHGAAPPPTGQRHPDREGGIPQLRSPGERGERVHQSGGVVADPCGPIRGPKWTLRWTLVDPSVDPNGPNGPNPKFSPEHLKRQAVNSAHAKWTLPWTQMDPCVGPCGPFGGPNWTHQWNHVGRIPGRKGPVHRIF
jgi:hypothetical protein